MLQWFFHTETADRYTTDYYTSYIASILLSFHAQSVDPGPCRAYAPGIMLPTLHEKALWGRFGGVTGIFFQRAWVLWVLWVLWILVMESSVCGCLGAFWDIFGGYINHHWPFSREMSVLNRWQKAPTDVNSPGWSSTRVDQNALGALSIPKSFGGFWRCFEAALDQSGLVADVTSDGLYIHSLHTVVVPCYRMKIN